MVWDARAGQEALTLKGHTGLVLSVAFSADGKRIASGSVDRTVKVWDAHTGQEALTLKGHTGTVWSVAFSADGKRIASGSGGYEGKGKPVPGGVKAWEARAEKDALARKGPTGAVRSVAFLADGRRLS